MTYFTAVITHQQGSWESSEVDLEDVSDLDDLVDCLRDVVPEGGSALAVLEHEDEWFALIRVADGEVADEFGDDVTMFVSDLPAASRSHYSGLLAPVADVEAEDDGRGEAPGGAPEPDDEDDDVAPEDPVEDDADAATSAGPWAGDPSVLADLGISRERMLEIAENAQDDPDSALEVIGGACGFEELLEALR